MRVTRPRRWGFPCCVCSPCAYMPSPIPRQDPEESIARAASGSESFWTTAFPRFTAGRLLHHPFRGLLSVHSHYGLHARQVATATLCTKGFSSFVASTAASVATGRSDPVPGRDFHPLKNSAFSRRTRKLGYHALPGHPAESSDATVPDHPQGRADSVAAAVAQSAGHAADRALRTLPDSRCL